MTELSISFIGHKGSLQDLTKHIAMSEKIGFDVVSCPDDFWFRDAFSLFSFIAVKTEKIGLFPITNPYSRRPPMIAREAATLDEISGGRLLLGLCSGGSLTLRPLNIPMWDRPIATLRETVEVCRRLVGGETVTFDGETIKLREAKLLFTPFRERFPIIFVGRGPKVLEMAGALGEGALLGGVPKAYLDFAIEQIVIGARKSKRSINELKIHSTISFSNTPRKEFEKFLRWRIPNIVMDTPDYVFEKSNIDSKTMEIIRKIKLCKSVHEAGRHVTNDVINLYSFVNDSDLFVEEARELFKKGVNGIAMMVPPGQEDQMLPVIRDEIIPHLKRDI